MKKYLLMSLLCIATGLLISIPFTASAASSGNCGIGNSDNLTYTLDDNGTLTVSGSGDMGDWSNAYHSPWRGSTEIKKLIVNEGVTSIGKYSLYQCKNLTEISIPSSVTSIGDCAFYDCIGIKIVTMHEELTNMGWGAFNGCTGIEKIYWNSKNISGFDRTYNYIFGYAGQNTDGLEVVFGDKVECIPPYAFKNTNDASGAPKLTSVSVSSSITSIGKFAFKDCVNLKSISIHDGITEIGTYAFQNCTGLERVYWNAINIPDYAKSNYLFANAGKNGNGIDFVFGESVETIPAYILYPAPPTTSTADAAVEYYPNIKSLTIGSNVTSIGTYAFYGCASLENLYWNAQNVGNFSGDNHILSMAGQNGSGVNIVFGDKVENIPAYMLYPYYHSGYETYLPKIKGITFGKNVKIIGRNAFTYLSLSSIELPESLTSIGNSAFAANNNLINIVIPESVTSVGSYAFQNCINLKTAIIGQGVTIISSSMFTGCTSLTDVSIPNRVTEIYSSAFKNCAALESIEIPENVTTIGISAFENCTALKKVTMMNAITLVNLYAFESCSSLSDVYYYGTEEEWGNITFEKNNYSLTGANIIYMKEIKTSVSEDEKNITVTAINISNGDIVVLALYNGQALADVQYKAYSTEGVVFTTDKAYTNAKVMVWQDIKNLKPLTNVKIVK